LSSGIAVAILGHLLTGLLGFAACGGFGMLGRADEKAKERGRRHMYHEELGEREGGSAGGAGRACCPGATAT